MSVQPRQGHHLINKINELIYDAFAEDFDDTKEIERLKSDLDNNKPWGTKNRDTYSVESVQGRSINKADPNSTNFGNFKKEFKDFIKKEFVNKEAKLGKVDMIEHAIKNTKYSPITINFIANNGQEHKDTQVCLFDVCFDPEIIGYLDKKKDKDRFSKAIENTKKEFPACAVGLIVEYLKWGKKKK